jgi:hypothetical protein
VKRLAILLAALALGLAVPSLATAQFGPTNIPTPLTQTEPSDNPAPSGDEDNGLSTWQYVLMFGGAIAVLAVIAWFIMRDARRAAPVAGRARVPEVTQTKKSARERERERQRKRSKAKAVKNQRRRNRPR